MEVVIEKFPLSSVKVPWKLPLMATETAETVSREAAFVTVPRTVIDCEKLVIEMIIARKVALKKQKLFLIKQCLVVELYGKIMIVILVLKFNF